MKNGINDPMTFLKKPQIHQKGFTIVELLVVIVVIGILAAITVVSYTGISQRASIATLQSDLSNAKTQFELYKAENGKYPAGIDCSAAPAANTICVKASPGNNLGTYTVDDMNNPQTFSLPESTNGGSLSYVVTNNAAPTAYVSPSTNCPSGFVLVPGSATYGTSSFCIAKYEAKNAGGNVPISQAAGLPWMNISQIDATTYSANVAGCTGCHLITEAEWLTAAQNVINVGSNWSSGTVGAGYIYSGHNDSAPVAILAADTNDSNGYFGETNVGGNQRRTLTLSNGNVIWDMSGNVQDWTAGQLTGQQPGAGETGTYVWHEWNAVTVPGAISPNPYPVFANPAAATWTTAANNIGSLFSNSGETLQKGFLRGGSSTAGASKSGPMMLLLVNGPTYIGSLVGFRMASPTQ